MTTATRCSTTLPIYAFSRVPLPWLAPIALAALTGGDVTRTLEFPHNVDDGDER